MQWLLTVMVDVYIILVFHRKDLCDARVNPEMSSYFLMKCPAQVYPPANQATFKFTAIVTSKFTATARVTFKFTDRVTFKFTPPLTRPPLC